MNSPTVQEKRRRLAAITANYHQTYPDKKALRRRLSERQNGLCALGMSPLPEHHISDPLLTEVIRKRPEWIFAESALPLEQAVREANAEDNLELVCNNCKSQKLLPDTKDFVCGEAVRRNPKKPKEFTKRFMVQVDDRMQDTVEALKSLSGISAAEIVRTALEEYDKRLVDLTAWTSRPDKTRGEHQIVALRRTLGKLFSGTPWTRETVRPELRPLFDALVEEGLLDTLGSAVTVSRPNCIGKLMARLAEEHLT